MALICFSFRVNIVILILNLALNIKYILSNIEFRGAVYNVATWCHWNIASHPYRIKRLNSNISEINTFNVNIYRASLLIYLYIFF